MAKNLTTAVAAESVAVLSGQPAPSSEEATRRLAICGDCDFFRRTDERCSHPRCGCYLRIKTAWRSQHCPVGKW